MGVLDTSTSREYKKISEMEIIYFKDNYRFSSATWN